MIKEFCAENFTNIPQAIHNGANRIELCDNLAVGGTTPSTGVLEESFAYTSEKSIPLMVMIRPRGGDFIYNDTELKIMHTDLIEAKKLGVDGVVFGCLTPSNWIDEEAMELLLDVADGLQVTFHMAFDAIEETRKKAAIDWLVAHQVDRILVHGGPLDTPIEEHLTKISEWIAYADGRITFVVGGGVRSTNAQAVCTKTGATEVHGTRIV
ncbi:copper homeostasis protein CutC [Enterococcus bulliens]